MKQVLKNFRNDASVVISGIFASVIGLLIIAMWRKISPEIFLFTQITVVTLILYILLHLASAKGILNQKHLHRVAIVLIVNMVLSTLLLNIDRSRSIYVLKWTYQNSKLGFVNADNLLKYEGFPPTERAAISQRLEEQDQIGTLKKARGGYELTLSGRIIVKISYWLADFVSLTGFKKA